MEPRLAAQGTNIVVRIHGSMKRTQVELSGTDATGAEMTPAQVIAVLTLGRMAESGLGSASATGELSSALTMAATGQLSGMVGRWAGLDVFEFRTGEGGLSNLSSGTLEVGTYVTDRLFVRVLQPIQTTQSGQEVSVEYRLLDWLKLRAQQSGKESSAFDLLFQIDWR